MSFVKDLNAPLLKLSRRDLWRGIDATSHTHFFGRSGGGKTTSAKWLAGAFLRAGWGAYISVVKPEDIPLWKVYAKKHGRGNSLVLFDGEKETFNFLDYLMAHGMEGIGTSVECLLRIVDAARKVSGTASQRGGDVFWEDTSRVVLRKTLPVLYSAKGSLRIPDIIRFLSTAPTNLKEPTDAGWQKRSFMYEVMDTASRTPKVRMSNAALKNTIDFWREQWPAIPDKTRGNIVITINAALDRFTVGRLERAFCRGTTLVPELSFHGGLILGATPTTTWNEDGIIAQVLFKFLWQRCVVSRNSLAPEHRERPVFLWCDEAQETVSSYDSEFLSICRASKCAVVYLSQTLPGYVAKIGGDSPRDAAHALVGKFANHVFMSNGCPETNEFAARMLGKVVTQRRNYTSGSSESRNVGMSAGNSENSGYSSNHGTSFGGQQWSANSGSGSNSGAGNNWGQNRGRGTSWSETQGCTETIEYAIEPGDFGRILKTGGAQNGNEVTGIWYQAGRVFSTGTNWLKVRFKQ
jgi:hypothetical protein